VRIYAPITVAELSELLAGGTWSPNVSFVASAEFLEEHHDLDEEESEYLLTLQAAHEALGDDTAGLVLVVESESIDQISKSDIECVFRCTIGEDDEDIDLAWFGPTELDLQINEWQAN